MILNCSNYNSAYNSLRQILNLNSEQLDELIASGWNGAQISNLANLEQFFEYGEVCFFHFSRSLNPS